MLCRSVDLLYVVMFVGDYDAELSCAESTNDWRLRRVSRMLSRTRVAGALCWEDGPSGRQETSGHNSCRLEASEGEQKMESRACVGEEIRHIELGTTRAVSIEAEYQR